MRHIPYIDFLEEAGVPPINPDGQLMLFIVPQKQICDYLDDLQTDYYSDRKVEYFQKLAQGIRNLIDDQGAQFQNYIMRELKRRQSYKTMFFTGADEEESFKDARLLKERLRSVGIMNMFLVDAFAMYQREEVGKNNLEDTFDNTNLKTTYGRVLGDRDVRGNRVGARTQILYREKHPEDVVELLRGMTTSVDMNLRFRFRELTINL